MNIKCGQLPPTGGDIGYVQSLKVSRSTILEFQSRASEERMKNSIGFRNSSHKQKGIALVTVLIMLVIMVTLVSVTSLLALSNRRQSTDSVLTAQAQYAAEAGVEMALKRVYWDPYTFWKASPDSTVLNSATPDPTDTVEFDSCAYKKWLTGIGFSALTVDLTANNSASCPYVNFVTPATGAPFPGLKNNSTVNFLSSDSSAIALDQGDYAVSIERRDSDSGDINLLMKSSGTVKNSSGTVVAQRVLSRTLKITADPYDGDRFAMLTTAANCSFCHLQVDTRQRALSPSGTFDRARLGFTSTTSGLDFAEKTRADVAIYGGMYIRADLSKVSTHGFSTGEFARYSQQKDGKVKAGPSGTMVANGGVTDTALTASGDYAFDGNASSTFYTDKVWNAQKLFGGTTTATTSPQGGANRPNGVFYHNYPTKAQVDDPTGVFKGKWPDGVLPDEFPAAIPDGGDGHISDADWNAFVSTAPSGQLEATNLTASAATRPVFYGVRRPSSSKVNTLIPFVYNPVVANNITNFNNLFTAADLQANPNNYKAWWITQALASPNNRDFLPTTPNLGANQLPFNTAPTNNAYQNNFYVNYNPTNTSLTFAFCSGAAYNAAPSAAAAVAGAARTRLEQCARGKYTSDLPTFVSNAGAGTNGNSLSSVTVTGIGSNVWFPQTSNQAVNDLTSGTDSGRNGYFDGNLIIDAGTLAGGRLPFKMSGTLLVNGDLVIRGKVLGTGRIVARGNIYVIGDLTYACSDSGTSCTQAQYAAGTDLPKLALLAGGNIIVGDYDAPDSRVANLNRSFDLTNDQTGRNQVPSAGVLWDYYNVPGSSGRAPRAVGGAAGADQFATIAAVGPFGLNAANPNGTVNFSGQAGFLTRSLAQPNFRSTNKQLFKQSPFGYIIASTSDNGLGELYEASGTFVNSVTKPISPLYPTNGMFKLGTNQNSGLVTTAAYGLTSANGYNTSLGCATSVAMPARRYMFSPIASGLSTLPIAGLVPLANLNFSFWCTPAGLNTNSYIRSNGVSNTQNPNTQAAAWMQVTANDAALDGGQGLTTGWLGGVLTDQNGNMVRGDLSQTRLLKLMWLSTMENGRATAPLRTDGIFYSANAIANILKAGQDGRSPASTTQSRWVHIGSVIASELGFLTTASTNGDTSGSDFTVQRDTLLDFAAATGSAPPANTASLTTAQKSWGAGFAILYDDRLQGFLQVTSTNRVKIKRTGVYAQVGVTR